MTLYPYLGLTLIPIKLISNRKIIKLINYNMSIMTMSIQFLEEKVKHRMSPLFYNALVAVTELMCTYKDEAGYRLLIKFLPTLTSLNVSPMIAIESLIIELKELEHGEKYAWFFQHKIDIYNLNPPWRTSLDSI